MAVVLMISIAAIYLTGRTLLRLNNSVAKQRVAVAQVDNVLSELKDLETGQRGFLLTEKEAYLEPYVMGSSHIRDDFSVIRQSVNEGFVPAAGVDQIETLASQKMDELQRTIALKRAGQTKKALQIVQTDAGKAIMDSIRGKARDLNARLNSSIDDAQREADHSAVIRNAVVIAAVLLNLLFLAWAYRQVSSEVAARLRSAVETQRQKELLSVTLASIGDAVIVTDTAGNITFLNNTACALTGWTAAEANGKRCVDVFKIINEQTRQIVESPVEKVIRTGMIVGLANHTLLIHKDGNEIPIDDSGAPIREKDGATRGVVLVFRDFSEHKQAEAALRKAKEEADAASRAKDQFLAALSHELRTPLSPVLATLTGWEVSDDFPAGLMPDLQMIRKNVELEARLIDDLLDVTRIVKGKMHLHVETLDVHRLLKSGAAIYQSEIFAKRLNLGIDLKASRVFMKADSARLQQVFSNMLRNAIKFTPERGTVSIHTEDSDGMIRIAVSDSGIGMTSEAIARLFRPFEQGNEEVMKRFGGLGLGLTICKFLVEAHGGRIEAASDGPGRGSTFTLSLPCLADAPAEGPLPLAVRKSQLANRPLRILLVEDHPDTARVMSSLLRRLGHEVDTAASVSAAMELFSTRDYELLLSDIGLPDGTGIDLLEKARMYYAGPAVALTGFGMEEDIARCLKAGFDSHMTKPITFDKLEGLLFTFSEAAGHATPERV